MHANQREYVEGLAHAVIGAAFEVSNELGAGFLEKVYENALVHELHLRGVDCEQQKRLQVHYKEAAVGDYVADLLVGGCLIVELKCVKALADEHLAQCLNYLKATGLTLSLLFNFQQPRIEFKRIVFNH